MSTEKTVQARELLERGAFTEAARAFLSVGEYAAAARALVCAKDYRKAAECFEKAHKPLDAARLYLQIHEWEKASELYTSAGDPLRASLALQKLQEVNGGEPRRPSPAPPLPRQPPPRFPAAGAPRVLPPSEALTIQPPQGPVPELTPLRDCSLFHRLGTEELSLLWSMGEMVRCATGEVLLKAGQKADGLYIILDGGLTITPNPGIPNLAVGFLGPSDYVGLGSLLMGPAQANALVGRGETRLLRLPIPSIEALLELRKDLGLRLFRSIAEHLVQTLWAGRPSGQR